MKKGLKVSVFLFNFYNFDLHAYCLKKLIWYQFFGFCAGCYFNHDNAMMVIILMICDDEVTALLAFKTTSSLNSV